MSEGWTCSRCSTVNVDGITACANCGLLRYDAASGRLDSASRRLHPALRSAESRLWRCDRTADAADQRVGRQDPTPSQAITGWVPPGDDRTAAAPAGLPLWRRIPIGWLVVAVFIAGGAIVGWYFNAGRSQSGEITRSGDMMAVDLRVGDCFDLKDPSADEVEDVTASPCTVAHEFEMFFVGSLPEGCFPARQRVRDLRHGELLPGVRDVCRQGLR